MNRADAPALTSSGDRAFASPSRLAPVIILLVVAGLLYRPWVIRPMDYVDFPENVLVMLANDDFVDRFEALTRVYLDHGRWSPVTLASVAAQWTWFEWWTPGWQVVRFLVMSTSIVLAHALVRRLGLTTTGGLASAALLVVSPVAVPAWLRLSTAEPLGVLFLLLASHLALRRRTTFTSWAFATALLGVMWTKEVMTSAFVFPVLLVCLVRESGSLGAPRWTRERWKWLAPAAFVFVIGSIPILWIWMSAPSGAFASQYARGSVSALEIAGATIATWLPFAPIPGEWTLALPIALVAFLGLILLGWHEALQENALRAHRRVLLALAVGVPVIGALFYAPWPFYLLVYALPFMPAGSLLLGQGSSSFTGTGALARLTATACLAIVLTLGLVQAANEASRTHALQQAFAASVHRVGELQGVDTVLVGVALEQFDSRGNFGPRFRTYARMLGLEWPGVRDVPCDALPTNGNNVVVLRLNLMCALPSNSRPSVVAHYTRFAWPNPRPRRDSVAVSLTALTPAGAFRRVP